MEFLADGVTAELLWEFALFGWALNGIAVCVSFIVTLFKAFALTPAELTEYRAFAALRQTYIVKYASAEKQFYAFLLNFLPTYTAWITMVYLFYITTMPGVSGLIRGTVMSDNWEIIQLVRYQFVPKNK